MSQTRILAIEDDPIAAESLRLAIEELGHIPIDVVDDVAAFRRLIKATQPDLLIFDIELEAELNGIELAKEIVHSHDVPFLYITSQHDPKVVEAAVESFPAAYLTKPIDSASLQAAITLASVKQSNFIQQSEPTFINTKGLFLKEESGFVRIDPDELLYAEASNKQCRLFFNHEEKLITGKLTDLAKQLPQDKFMQVHRSFVVNLEQIGQIDNQFKQLDIRGTQIPVGRSYKESLMTRLLKIG